MLGNHLGAWNGAMEQLAPTQRSCRNSDDPDCPGRRARICALIKLLCEQFPQAFSGDRLVPGIRNTCHGPEYGYVTQRADHFSAALRGATPADLFWSARNLSFPALVIVAPAHRHSVASRPVIGRFAGRRNAQLGASGQTPSRGMGMAATLRRRCAAVDDRLRAGASG